MARARARVLYEARRLEPIRVHESRGHRLLAPQSGNLVRLEGHFSLLPVGWALFEDFPVASGEGALGAARSLSPTGVSVVAGLLGQDRNVVRDLDRSVVVVVRHAFSLPLP